MGEILKTFVEDASTQMQAIKDAVASRDAPTIERSAHAYKSAAGTVRAHSLAEVLRRAEMAAKAGDVSAACGLLADITQAHEQVVRYLEAAGQRGAQ